MQFWIVHEPPTQCSVVPASTPHGEVQLPQCAVSVFVLSSHPSDALLLQSPQPALHRRSCTRSRRSCCCTASVAFVVLHALPHFPQLLVVVIAVSQPPTVVLQSAKPALQLIVQIPPTQVPTPLVWLHTLPQLPQLFGSSVRLTSQPFATLPSQSLNPVLHDAIAHFDDAHSGVPFGATHTFPHPLQFFTSVEVLTSHPFAPLPSQSAVLAPHFVTSHIEFWHCSTNVPVFAHGLLHFPQLLESFAMWSSQPSDAFLLQSPYPA